MEHWEIDIIITPILKMKKLRLRDSHREVAEPGASPGSFDPKVQALSISFRVATYKSGL